MASLPQFVSIADDGVVEYYLDHTLLQSLRQCESKFCLDFIENYRGKGKLPWALQFGTLFHECMEFFYAAEIKGLYPAQSEFATKFCEFGAAAWHRYGMDLYKDLPQYKKLGGFQNFIVLLGQYLTFYKREFNRLKPVALEIAFGRNKEVPLLEDHNLYKWAPFRLYYAGRLDYIFDDGTRLGPLDHKTFSRTDKNPLTSYEVQEGMTGYVYAMKYIYDNLKKFGILIKQGDGSLIQQRFYERRVDCVWMNFIAVPYEADIFKRFQRIPLFKSDFQLEEWRLRQISSTAKLHQILFEGRQPDFNAAVCTNMFYGTCPYQDVHRQATAENQLVILNSQFEKQQMEWNPETPRTFFL